MLEEQDVAVTTTDLSDLDIPDSTIAVQFFTANTDKKSVYEEDNIPLSPLTYLGGEIINLNDAQETYANESLHAQMMQAGVETVIKVDSPKTLFQPLSADAAVVNDDFQQVWPEKSLDM